MKRLLLLLFAYILLLPTGARANDDMFPPAPAAAPYIHFDGRGFVIRGKRTFIVSGSLHYARVPRALWSNILLKMKRAGFNTVQTYVFWNYHEPEPGVFDFHGRHNLDAFLKLVHKMGMYATLRVGPYYCAEWDSGGYPVWLRFIKGLKVREADAPFETAVQQYFRKLLPIVARNQINHGGPVILVQLENEDPQGWGTDMPNQYFRFLKNLAVKYGIQTPFFFSGLHHGSDPAGSQPWSSKNRTTPWYTTEFWPGWYNLYGPLDPARLRFFTRGTWKIIAYGGCGYNYYMLHGGTNFGYTNDDEVAACYDYGGAIGQAGDLRPIYYRFKKAALFARSMQQILETSDNATAEYANAAANSALQVTARSSAYGTILFLDNNTGKPQATVLHTQAGSGTLTVQPGEIRPVIMQYAMLPGIQMHFCTYHLLSIVPQGRITTLVLYNPAGEKGEIDFQAPNAHGFRGTAGKWNMLHGLVSLHAAPHAAPQLFSFASQGKIVRILLENSSEASRTWPVEANGKHFIVAGPYSVGAVWQKGSVLHVQTSTPAGKTQPAAFVLANNFFPSPLHSPRPASLPAAPVLYAWQQRSGHLRAARHYAASFWLTSNTPRQMGADGYNGAYAWYRSTVNVPKAGKYIIHFSDAGDWFSVWINGVHAANGQLKRRYEAPVAQDVTVALPAGTSTLAVLTAHYGRPKLYSYLGPMRRIMCKGLAGPVTWENTRTVTASEYQLTRWQGRPAPHKGANGPQRSDAWQPVQVGKDLFAHQPGWLWVRTFLPTVAGKHHTVAFQGVDDNGTVYLNGVKLLVHQGWNDPFRVSLDSAWNPHGPNELEVLIHNTDGTGGLIGPITLSNQPALPGTPIEGWQMRGGIGPVNVPSALWQPLAALPQQGGAEWYRAQFTIPHGNPGACPVLRLQTTGMSGGFVWLNGHNLGRYPELTPAPGLYLPPCWLKNGKNSIVIFDEQGLPPLQAHLIVEKPASRLRSMGTAHLH